MRINNNISALNAFNSLTQNTNHLQDSIRQLSTGLRINSASDDAAGLAISEAMRSQINGLGRAIQNAQDGISLLQTAEGAMGETNSILQRMRELTVQGANDTLTSQDRNYIQMEIDALKSQIDRIADTTQFNKKRLLDGSCCGVCTSTDTTTKGYIRGAINVEGNYRIDVRTNPGQAQVQKSSIFKVKHENTITNMQTDSESGLGNIEIDNVPAGDFQITATKAGGGVSTVTYGSKASVSVTKGNESGAGETLTARVEFTNKKTGATTHEDYKTDTISAIDMTKTGDELEALKKANISSIYEALAGKLNAGEISLGSGDSKANLTLQAVKNGDSVKITSTSEDWIISNVTFSTDSTATTAIEQNTQPATTADTSYTADLSRKITSGLNAGDTITINIDDGTGGSAAKTISVTSELDADGVGALIAGITNETITLSGGGTVTLSGSYDSGTDFYKLSATNGKNSGFKISVTLGSGTAQTSGAAKGASTFSDSRTFNVTSGNTRTSDPTDTSKNAERVRITISGGSYGGTSYSGSNYIDVDIPAGTSDSEVAALIKAKIDSNPYISVGGRGINLECDYTSGTGFTLKSTNSDAPVTFSILKSTPGAVTSTSAELADPDETMSEYTKTSTANNINQFEKVDTDSGAVTSLTGFYGSDDAADSITANVTSSAKNNASILFEVTNAITDSNGTTITLSASSNVLGTDGSQSRYEKSSITFSTTNADNPVDISSLLGEESGSLTLKLDPTKFAIGNKFVLSVSGNGSEADNTKADTSLYIKAAQDSTWPYNWGDYATYNNNELYYNVNASAVSNSELHFRNYYLNSDNGNVHEGDIKLTINENFAEAAQNFVDPPAEGEVKTSENLLASFTSNYVGKIADADTKLRDLEQFWDKSGVFMLSQPQTITISQKDGKKASVTLYESDTLNDVSRKLNNAIANDLDQGRYVKGGNANNIVTYVEKASSGGMESVKGTFLIRSLVPGSAGELTFSSDNGDLIDSLGLNTVQKSENGSYTVSVYNAHDNTAIAQNIKTSGNILEGVIDKNIDVEFDPMSGVKAVWSDTDKNFILSPESEIYSTTLHIVKNNIAFQTGAGEGEDISLDIGDMSSQALGLDGVNVANHERASQSITILDRAIRQLSSQRSKIGAYQNALEHTIEDLTLANTNLTAAESRIRDADMSKSMLDLVKFQIINQTSTSMLAQANQLPQSVLNLLQ